MLNSGRMNSRLKESRRRSIGRRGNRGGSKGRSSGISRRSLGPRNLKNTSKTETPKKLKGSSKKPRDGKISKLQ